MKAPEIHFASYYRWLVATQYWQLPLHFDTPVLDIGADDGGFLARVQAPLKVALDLAPPRARLPFARLQGDGRCLPFASGSFGHIFAFDVIEHVVEDTAVLAEAVRVLQPGGTLWLSTPAHQFRIFPGGAIQRRFERSIGHVRRGYSQEMLLERLPAGVTVDLMWWQEPLFRAGYIWLYALKRLSFALPNRLIPAVVRYDAGRTAGEAGHLFARITKDAV